LTVFAALATTVMVAGCSSGSDPEAALPDTVVTTGAATSAVATTTVATTVAAPTPTTDAPLDEGAVPDTELLDALLETRDPAGGMSLDSALAAFAAVYGGLPGVATPASSPAGIDGTTAARWLTAHRDQLTDDQRAAVDRAMSPLDIDGSPLPAGDAPGPSGFRTSATPPSATTGCFGGTFAFADAPGAGKYRGPAIPTSTITNGGGYSSALGEAQAEADLFSLQAEVVVVEIAGGAKGRFSFPGTADEALSARHEWCTLGYPCVCPDDTTRAGLVVDQTPANELAVGAAGIAAGGTLIVTGMTFEDYCGPKVPTTTLPPAPPVVDPCLVGSWISGEWMIPGPPGADIDLHGGAGIAMTIDAAGVVTTDFTGMAPMTGFIEQTQTGGLTQQITAAGGTVDELVTNRNMSIGPGVFAIWGDSTRYDCGTDAFTLIAFDPVELVDIPIPFVRAG
jgi:hypothetical protein